MIKFAHNNFNVLDLEKSLQFYQEALNLKEVRRTEKPDFTLVYLGDNGETPHTLELTWLKDRKEPYNLGENEFHLAFVTDDYDYENPMMGIYFINDPDGYWLEILPVR